MAASAPNSSENLVLNTKNNDFVVQLEEIKEQIKNLQVMKQRKLANPAAVGCAGFGLTTMVLQFENIGWMHNPTPVVVCGLVFGGLAQLIAGLQEFRTGNAFGYTVFTTYGSFWISLALLLIGTHFGWETDPHTMAFFLLAFTLYTGFVLIASAGTNIMLFITFILLFTGFVLLDIGHFWHDSAADANVAAGWVLLVCALTAWYVMLHVVYLDTFQYNLLPVGPPPANFVKKLFAKSRHIYGVISMLLLILGGCCCFVAPVLFIFVLRRQLNGLLMVAIFFVAGILCFGLGLVLATLWNRLRVYGIMQRFRRNPALGKGPIPMVQPPEPKMAHYPDNTQQWYNFTPPQSPFHITPAYPPCIL